MHHWISVCVTLCGIIWISLATENFFKLWHYDVYTGRHFDELVTSPGSDVVVKPALLILYGPDCLLKAMQLKVEVRPWGPSDKYMTLAFHDHVLYRKRLWYDRDRVDDLRERYAVPEEKCLTVLYFPMGRRLSNPARFNGSLSGFYDWLWQKMLMKVEVRNALPRTVKLRLEGQGNPRELVTLNRWQSEKVLVHISMSITVYSIYDAEWKDVLYYHLIEPYSSLKPLVLTMELCNEFKKTLDPNWLSVWRDRLKGECAEAYRQQMEVASRYWAILEQPVNWQRFTETGYMKLRLPKDMFQQMKEFYREADGITRNDFTSGDLNQSPVIGDHDNQVWQLSLPEELKETVLLYLNGVCGDWCDCLLESETTGLLEHQTGSYINSHVTSYSDFTAVLQIEDYSAETPWPLEVIGFDGKRHSMELSDGDLLLYNAGTVVFGRPRPYRGELYVCMNVDFFILSTQNYENDPTYEEVEQFEPTLDAEENQFRNEIFKDEF